MNRLGRTYYPGANDSARGLSSVVSNQGLASATIPRLGYSEAQWQQFMSCIQDEFARFDVTVTDQRPASGAYIEASIGGNGTEVGFGSGVGGVAPVDTYYCRPIPAGVVFIFAQKFSPMVACEIASQEIAHALVPLDHEYLASDPMTYLGYNGHKTFQDIDAQCGEYQTKQCYCNRATQNSVKLLYATVGPKGSTPPVTPPPTTGDTTPPSVKIASPAAGTTIAENSTLDITVQASDNVGVSSVLLYWLASNRALACDNTVAGVTCTQSGSTYKWSFKVGTGTRSFYAQAQDAAGNTAKTETMTVTLGGGVSNPTPTDAPPSVRLDSPRNGDVITRGGTLMVQAAVQDDVRVAEVFVNWKGADGSVMKMPMHETTAGTWALSSTVSPQSPVGARTFTVSAVDSAGQTTNSPMVRVTIQ